MDQAGLVGMFNDQLLNNISGKTQAILVTGRWGTGKSWAWKKFESVVHEHNKTLYHPQTQKRCVLVSFFGFKDIESMRQRLKVDVLLKGDGGPVKGRLAALADNPVVKTVISQLSGKTVGVSFDPIALIPLALGPDWTVCFDDLERLSPQVPMVEALGFVNEIRQLANVVVLADLSKLNGENERVFEEFKEKTVDRTFELTEPGSLVVKGILDSLVVPEHKGVVEYLFNLYGAGNLRTLQKMIDFVNSLQKHIEIDERVVRIACGVVLEWIAGTLNCEAIWRAPVTEIDDQQRSFYRTYGVDLDLSLPVSNICTYYTTSKWNISAIKEALNPPAPLPDEAMLKVLQNPLLYNKTRLTSEIQEFARVLQKKEVEFFRDITRVITLFFYAKVDNTTLNLGLNDAQWETEAEQIIQLMIPNSPLEELKGISGLTMYFMSMPGVVDQLIDRISSGANARVLVAAELTFRNYWRDRAFTHCLAIVRHNPGVVSKVMDVFDLLKASECQMSTISFFAALRNGLPPAEKAVVDGHLQSIIAGERDSVVQERVKSVLR